MAARIVEEANQWCHEVPMLPGPRANKCRDIYLFDLLAGASFVSWILFFCVFAMLAVYIIDSLDSLRRKENRKCIEIKKMENGIGNIGKPNGDAIPVNVRKGNDVFLADADGSFWYFFIRMPTVRRRSRAFLVARYSRRRMTLRSSPACRRNSPKLPNVPNAM